MTLHLKRSLLTAVEEGGQKCKTARKAVAVIQESDENGTYSQAEGAS